MTLNPPTALTTDDATFPLSVGTHVRLRWISSQPFQAREVRILTADGQQAWGSGIAAGTLPALTAPTADLSSHATYFWQVRVWVSDQDVTPWSDKATFETALLHHADRRATWIGLPVPTAHRIIRSIEHDRTDWAVPGDLLAQSFTSTGAFTAITVDLIGRRGTVTEGQLQLLRADDGSVISTRRLAPVQFPGDRFAHWLDLDTPAPAGEYLVQLTVVSGTIGWRTSTAPSPADDLGVYPIAVQGAAGKNGTPVEGTRTLGIETIPAPNPTFRRSFTLSDRAHRGRLTLSALGYASATINGQPVTLDVLEPAPTDVTHRVLSRTYDITTLLVPGENVIEIQAGRGYVGTRGASTWSWNLAPHHQEPAVFAELSYDAADGTHDLIVTDQSWQARAGETVFDSLYGGETQDLTTTRESWSSAVVVPEPPGELAPGTLPPVRRHTPLPVKNSTRVSPSSVVNDFGAVTAGWVRVVVKGEPGDRITIDYAEQADDAGDILFENVLIAGRAQTDEFVLSSAGDQILEPKFTYKGFRFARITMPSSATVLDVSAIPVHTAVEPAGTFASSHELLNWIDQATARSILNNLHGIPTDTPAYEKNGWTADAHLIAETALHHFDLRSFFDKWLLDHADAQLADGTIPQIVPTPGWGLAPDPAWAASYPLILWNLYWEYGDQQLLEQHLPHVLRYVYHLADLVRETGWLWQDHSWGDWLAPGHHFAPEGATPTASLMLLKSVQTVRAITEVLGRYEDTDRLRQVEQQVAEAYNDAYLDRASGRYLHSAAGYRQTMNILPLAFGIVPAQYVADVARSLADDTQNRTNSHLDVGSIGTKYLLPVLTAAGYGDLARTVATQLDRPGWGLWQQSGSSTLWESWDANVRSHDHYFLGSIGQWMHEEVAGVRSIAPAWSSVVLTPQSVPGISRGELSHNTVYGKLRFAWTAREAGVEVVCDVPLGIDAVLQTGHLGHGVIDVDGVTNRRPGEWDVAPGQYEFIWTSTGASREIARQ